MYWLPKNITLSGGVLTEYFNRVSLSVSYIPNNSWASFEEFAKETYEIHINFLVAHETLDAKNFEDPISTVIDDQYYISIHPSSFTYYDFSIQKNQYEIDNGYLLSDIKQGNLYQVGGTASSVIGDNYQNKFFISNFKLSSGSKIYKSQVYQFFDALGTIGGVFELFFGILFFIFSFVSRNLYFFHMVNNLKQVENQDIKSRDREVEALENQNYHDENKSRLQQSHQSMSRVKRDTFGLMVRNMNKNLLSIRTRHSKNIRKLDLQK